MGIQMDYNQLDNMVKSQACPISKELEDKLNSLPLNHMYSQYNVYNTMQSCNTIILLLALLGSKWLVDDDMPDRDKIKSVLRGD